MKPVDSISSNLGVEVPIYFDGNHNFYYLLCTGVMQKSVSARAKQGLL